jgi:hypothetical protein
MLGQHNFVFKDPTKKYNHTTTKLIHFYIVKKKFQKKKRVSLQMGPWLRSPMTQFESNRPPTVNIPTF